MQSLSTGSHFSDKLVGVYLNLVHSPYQSGQVYSLLNIDTHSPLHFAQSLQRLLTSKDVLCYIKKKGSFETSKDVGYMCGTDPLDRYAFESVALLYLIR